ncbi:hypothetical protein JCM11957_03360 [Caminibacter profundus]
MYEVVLEKRAEKEFLSLDKEAQKIVAKKLLELKKGNFFNNKALKGKYKGKFRKRAGDYRIIYVKENNIITITVVRIAHRREVY